MAENPQTDSRPFPLRAFPTKRYLYTMKEWRAQAKCADPRLPSQEINALFFPTTTSTNPRVQQFCNGCIVQIHCLNYGVLYKEEGYWGGLNLTRRLEIRPHLLSYLQSEALKEGPLESRNLDEFIGMVDGIVDRGENIIDIPENLLDYVERLLANNKRFISELIFPIAQTPA